MTRLKLSPRQYLDRVAHEIEKLDPAPLQALADAIHDCYVHGRTVFILGNGGSGSNATHFCADIGKNYLPREKLDDDSQRRLRILSLTDNTASILAWANDEGFDRVFVEQLKNHARPGDLVVAISCSGNSPNVIRAVEWANRNGLTTFGCTGCDGGALRHMSFNSLHVPLDDFGIVESIHLVAFHWVVDNMYHRVASGMVI